jgi:hypothetical protein
MFLVHIPRPHAEIVDRAVVGACRLEGWQSPVQPQLLHTLFNRLLGQDLDFEKRPGQFNLIHASTAGNDGHPPTRGFSVLLP